MNGEVAAGDRETLGRVLQQVHRVAGHDLLVERVVDDELARGRSARNASTPNSQLQKYFLGNWKLGSVWLAGPLLGTRELRTEARRPRRKGVQAYRGRAPAHQGRRRMVKQPESPRRARVGKRRGLSGCLTIHRAERGATASTANNHPSLSVTPWLCGSSSCHF